MEETGVSDEAEPDKRFPGFAISGYRSLWGEPQFIPLDGDVTVILGGNNSGKSNVVRLIHEHLGGLFKAVQTEAKNSNNAGFSERFDKPADRGHEGLVVYWPVDLAFLPDKYQDKVTPNLLEPLLEAQALRDFGPVTVAFEARTLDGDLTVSRTMAEKALREGGVNWDRLSQGFTRTSSNPIGNVERVLDVLRSAAVPPPQTVFVPPSRKMTAGDSSAKDWDFSGDSVLGRLHRMKNPEYDENHLREQARRLTQDLRILLEDPDLEFEVAHDRSTLNVKLDGRYFPLPSLGTGTEHAVLILAAKHVYPDSLLLLEEPDAHLHPRLQRRLMSLVRDPGKRQILVATHSAHLIDNTVDTVLSMQRIGGRSSIDVVGDAELFEQLRAVGYRASDLLQANSVVWVEGPSDRIYLLHWIRELAPELVEGIDFSIMFYGGALLSHLTAERSDAPDPNFVDLWRINQRMWLVMDSDKAKGGELKPAVQRLQQEIERDGQGGSWITEGYTIENYIPPPVLLECARQVHPSVVDLPWPRKDRDPLTHLARRNKTTLARVDKVGIALEVAARPAVLDRFDLRERIEELVDFIRGSDEETLE